MKVEPIVNHKDTLDNAVYSRLKEMIVNGQLEPGVPIIQSQLSELLGVSRTPLRKAMGQLEAEGLLTQTARGWYVQEFTVDDMISVFEIRAVLEGLACRLAAPKIDPPNLVFMKAMFQQAYDAYVERADREAYFKADWKFHSYVFEIANHPLLNRTMNSYNIVATSMIKGLYRDPHETYAEHLAIIDAFSDGNASRVEDLMRAHIRKAIPLIREGKIHLPK